MRLASSCGYPAGYFDDLGADSDEDLEIERNDVRDLLRSLVAFPDADESNGVDRYGIPLGLLQKLLMECQQSLTSCTDREELFPEIVLHAFSALGECLVHFGKRSMMIPSHVVFLCQPNPSVNGLRGRNQTIEQIPFNKYLILRCRFYSK